MKKTFLFSLIILISTQFFALPFNDKLSQEDLEKLEKGEVLIKNINKYKNVAIQGNNPGIERIYNEIKSLNPNYLVELIQIRPYKGNEDLPQKMRAVLEDIEGYAGIQYWSVQHDRYYDLYESAKILEKEIEDEKTTKYMADLYMEPFGIINTPITIEQTDDYLLYINKNKNDLWFEKKFFCVGKNNMKSTILLIRDGENWIIYGLGGCKTLKIAIFKERLERSFINRIKTFCNYIYTKI